MSIPSNWRTAIVGSSNGWDMNAGGAIQSAPIGHSGVTTLALNFVSAAVITIRVSSEGGCDFMEVLDKNGVVKASISGEATTKVTIDPNLNPYTFRYRKDGSVVSGSDAGFITDIPDFGFWNGDWRGIATSDWPFYSSLFVLEGGASVSQDSVVGLTVSGDASAAALYPSEAVGDGSSALIRFASGDALASWTVDRWVVYYKGVLVGEIIGNGGGLAWTWGNAHLVFLDSASGVVRLAFPIIGTSNPTGKYTRYAAGSYSTHNTAPVKWAFDGIVDQLTSCKIKSGSVVWASELTPAQSWPGDLAGAVLHQSQGVRELWRALTPQLLTGDWVARDGLGYIEGYVTVKKAKAAGRVVFAFVEGMVLVDSAVTDADGYYRMDNLPLGLSLTLLVTDNWGFDYSPVGANKATPTPYGD